MLKTFEDAQDFINSFIPQTLVHTYTADWGINRTKYLLKLLDNPQNKLNIIHVAGTSGKGSTSYLISILLNSLNKKVGLALSPHLIDIRERLQINNRLISKKSFVSFVNDLAHQISKLEKTKFGKPTYFEIMTVLAFYVFFKEKVDFAVMETGLGGLFDATNTVETANKIDVITKLGLDHTQILGKTIEEIAKQKAGIIHSGNTVFSIDQVKKAQETIIEKSKEVGANLRFITEGNFSNILLTKASTEFDFSFENLVLKNIKLGMLGEHQAENCSLALAVAYFVSQKYKFRFDEKKIRKVLKTAIFHGRMEIIKKKALGHTRTIILDGAHNPQKMQSFLNSLKKIFPNKKFNFLIAIKKDKDYDQMLKLIIPLANKIVITTFFLKNMDLIRFSEDPMIIANTLSKLGFNNWEVCIPNNLAIKQILKEDYKNDAVITGSLYLLSEIYPFLHEKTVTL